MTEPDIKILENFLTHEECTSLINTYKDLVKRSTVLGNKKHINTEFVEHSGRTSYTAYTSNDDEVIKTVKKKAAEYVNMTESHVEGIQFLRYNKGQLFNYHYDAFDVPENGYQRVHTLLVYLNSLNFDDGGSTSFKHYNLKVYPVEGRAIWFRNANDEGTIREDKSLHSGDPVLTDVTKYALNIWVRNKAI